MTLDAARGVDRLGGGLGQVEGERRVVEAGERAHDHHLDRIAARRGRRFGADWRRVGRGRGLGSVGHGCRLAWWPVPRRRAGRSAATVGLVVTTASGEQQCRHGQQRHRPRRVPRGTFMASPPNELRLFTASLVCLYEI